MFSVRSPKQGTNSRGGYMRGFALTIAYAAGASLSIQAAAAETKSFAMNMFTVASVQTEENCPHGLNPLSDVYFARELKRLGKTPSEIEELMKDFPSGGYIPFTTMRGRDEEGNPVNIYAYPDSQPDPNIFLVEGTAGYGFNLDGKASDEDFTDPETGEGGVDNQIWRAVGCTHNYHISLPEIPLYPFAQWDGTRDTTGAWLITVSDVDDWSNDDDVTLRIDKAIDPIIRDANDNTVRDMTFRVDPSARSTSIAKAKIKDGELTTESFDLIFVPDPSVMHEFNLAQAQVRAKFTDDGRMEAFVGGYHDYMAFYWVHAQGEWTFEHSTGLDLPGMYNALKKSADYDPDPETGENRRISGTWWFDAVPAYVISPEEVALQ
jgi:hypothetical protein